MISLRNNNFRLAYQSIRATRARSTLTMFGIVIGVMAVILVVCIGQGIKQQIAGQLGNYGKDVLAVEPSASSAPGLSMLTGLSGASSSLLTAADLHTVQKTHGVSKVVPLAITSGSMKGDHAVTSPFIVATSADMPDLINHPFASGGFFDATDNTKAVVLGTKIAGELFDNNAPLGQGLIWRGQRFLVAGVYDPFNAPPFSLEANFDDAVFIPYSVAQKVSGNALNMYEILVRSSSASDALQVGSAINSALVSAHGGAQDVTVTRASDSKSGSDQTIHLLTALVAGAAVIAMVVGGVGIMDVMLVSVTERMHEVGIRKAIGATNQQIMRQFVAEAFVLSAIGAVLGVLFSAAGVGLLRAYTSVQAVLVWQVMIVAPLIAIAIGVFFGSMPALKAARKDPIEALRHE